MAKAKQVVAAAAAIVKAAAIVTAAADVTVKSLSANDKAAAAFFMEVTETMATLSAAMVDARSGSWADTVELYSDKKRGFTWQGVEDAAPELLSDKARRSTYTSIKTTITSAVRAGIVLLGEDGKPKGKTAVELETKAKDLGVSLTDEKGEKKTQKVLRADCALADKSADETEGDTGNKGETVALTNDQIVDIALRLMASEFERYALPNKAKIGGIVALLDNHAKAAQKAMKKAA